MEHHLQRFQWHYTEFSDRNFEIHGKTLFFLIVLLILLFALTLIFLYARWACSYHRLSPSINNNNTDSSSSAAATTPAAIQGLNSDSIRRLPIVLHQSPSSSCSVECCICLGAFEDGEKVKVLPPCNHCFHPHCVDAWLINRSSCPLCRASLLSHPNGVVQVVVE